MSICKKSLNLVFLVLLILFLLTGCQNSKDKENNSLIDKELERLYNVKSFSNGVIYGPGRPIGEKEYDYAIAKYNDSFVSVKYSRKTEEFTVEEYYSFNDDTFINNTLRNAKYLIRYSDSQVYVSIILKENTWDTFESLYKDSIYEITKYLFSQSNNIYSVQYQISITSDNIDTDEYKALLIGKHLNGNDTHQYINGDNILTKVNLVKYYYNGDKNGGYTNTVKLNIYDLETPISLPPSL